MTTTNTTRPARVETYKTLNAIAARNWKQCPKDTAGAIAYLTAKVLRRRSLTEAGFNQLLRMIGERQRQDALIRSNTQAYGA